MTRATAAMKGPLCWAANVAFRSAKGRAFAERKATMSAQPALSTWLIGHFQPLFAQLQPGHVANCLGEAVDHVAAFCRCAIAHLQREGLFLLVAKGTVAKNLGPRRRSSRNRRGAWRKRPFRSFQPGPIALFLALLAALFAIAARVLAIIVGLGANFARLHFPIVGQERHGLE